MKLSRNKILITGGASGIGLGLAQRFTQQDNTVIVCGRREDVMQQAAAALPALITRRCDLALAEDREALFEWIAAEHGDLNVLVNNAGIQQWMGPADKDFYARARSEIAVNIEAPIHLASLFLGLPSLTTILNVTSGLSFVPLTRVPVYSATKAFFHSFTLSLRHLLQARGIEVIEIIPPALNTDLGGKGLHDHAPAVGEFIEAIFEQLREGKVELTFGFSETVSKAGQDVLRPIFDRMNPAQ
ncbi:MAG TPA: SDR family NAD(P)-dependent oxidoreductase [Xanthomonadaceae bacterium]|jgi:uncharacterized oxidoreductase|nr:SDR family NAD(P)-dependent oxidoreductase [Xanthomonadaceae bacterium]